MNIEDFKAIKISDFDYELPQEMIAQKPLSQRDQSKLLVYKNGSVDHSRFDSIGKHLPKDALLIFNNTRVIPARIFATKSTGARIQIFLLSPVSPYAEVERALKIAQGKVVWRCMIGNAKRWKPGEVLEIQTPETTLRITLENKEERCVGFEWEGDIEFCDVIESIGKMPLPPYIKREAQTEDETRYQTVFAKTDGAVAAPTAGLHFSDPMLNALRKTGVQTSELTLHVGAGTFKPVEEDYVWNHPMHEEFFQVNTSFLTDLLKHPIRIATGTTSLRTLETLYWVGVQLLNNEENPFVVNQHTPYTFTGQLMSYEESIQTILDHVKDNEISEIVGRSGIMIMPGYEIKSVVGLITNFHLPKSTLLLLISAFVGDQWTDIYQNAIQNNYRFLSYGDSSLLLK